MSDRRSKIQISNKNIQVYVNELWPNFELFWVIFTINLKMNSSWLDYAWNKLRKLLTRK